LCTNAVRGDPKANRKAVRHRHALWVGAKARVGKAILGNAPRCAVEGRGGLR
jgi:hypothetical protein